ncbi:helix-turn-helix domain-containing protein [Streptomyces sp. NPDC059835]|uniref:helix-turn-helix domain-containing protein n=1 Tax=Streptomyces sp. NPDC059835 TaxID=3346967 RepID=UPI00365DDFB0
MTSTDPTADTVAAAIRRLRTGRGWTTRELADRLTEAGRPFSHAGITRTEKGTRQVTVGDLAAFAAVFDVSPVALLLPLGEDGTDTVEITGGGTLDADRAWVWALGEGPLRGRLDNRAELWRYQTESLPPNLRHMPKKGEE